MAADIYGNTGKGSVLVFKDLGGALQAGSIVQIPGFTDKIGTSVFVIDFSASLADGFTLLPCFGNKTYVFSTGPDIPGSVSSCSLIIFLGSGDNCQPADNSAVINTLTSFYHSNKLSEKGSPVDYKLGGSASIARGYLISLEIRGYNAALNAITATVKFISYPQAEAQPAK